MVLGADRDSRSFRCASGTSFRHRIADLPQVWRDFCFFPLAWIVVPLVTAANLHAGIALTFVLLELSLYETARSLLVSLIGCFADLGFAAMVPPVFLL